HFCRYNIVIGGTASGNPQRAHRIRTSRRSGRRGVVSRLARPGGNITRFFQYEDGVGAKWGGIIKQNPPQVNRVAVVYDSANPESKEYLPVIEAAARSLGVQVSISAVRDAAEIERAIEEFAREPNGALIPLPGPLMGVRRDLIISLATRHRLPNVYAF